MSSAPGPVGHYDDRHKTPAPLLPVIPDLRFESSYVRSVRRYVEVERVGPSTETGTAPVNADLLRHTLVEDDFERIEEEADRERRGLRGQKGEVAVAGSSEIIRVRWKSVIWVTVRDQVISPLIQGALWALVSSYITPFSSQIGSRMGTFVHQSIPSKEGTGVTWLRTWTKNIGFSSSTSQQPRMYNSSSHKY